VSRRGVKVVGTAADASKDGQFDTPQLRYAQQLPYCRGAKKLRGTANSPTHRLSTPNHTEPKHPTKKSDKTTSNTCFPFHFVLF